MDTTPNSAFLGRKVNYNWSYIGLVTSKRRVGVAVVAGERGSLRVADHFHLRVDALTHQDIIGSDEEESAFEDGPANVRTITVIRAEPGNGKVVNRGT